MDTHPPKRGLVWRFWREVFLSAWRQTELLSRRKLLTTLGMSIVALILQYELNVRTLGLTIQIIGTVVISYLIIALIGYVWNVITVPAIRDKQLNREVDGLREQLNTELEITFDEMRGEFVDKTDVVWNGQSTMCKLYRVAVTHRSKSTVAELKAEQVITVTPPSRTYPPLHLRLTGYHDPPEKQARLTPNTPVFWDVVEKPDSERKWVKLMHIEKERDILQEIGRSTFRITASCDEGFPITKLVTLGLKKNGDLDFQLSESLGRDGDVVSSQKVGSIPSSKID
jgi:hypothetical protein